MALPPEVHSTLLTAGEGPAGITEAGASWTHVAAEHAAGIAELEGIIASVQANYTGESALQFVAAHQPYLTWMTSVLTKATLAAAAHETIAAQYVASVAAMPTMPELIANHVQLGVLVGTNFFGCNTIPIGMNEADYTRMWNQASDVMLGWDTGSSSAAAGIPPTLPSPFVVAPGVGEGGSIAASAVSAGNTAEAQAGGMLLNAGDMVSDKLLVGKMASSPASAADGGAPSTSPQSAEQDAAQQAPSNMATSMIGQVSSIAPSAAQSALGAAQSAGPQQLLSSAPQMLSSAPETLGQLLSNMGGGAGAGGQGVQQAAVPLGFAGTGAISGLNPAGVTSLSGGAFGSGLSRPMMPSSWGSPISSAAETETAAARPLAVAAPMASGGGAGAGSGGAMMGGGASRRKTAQQVATTYADTAVDDEEDEDSVGARGNLL